MPETSKHEGVRLMSEDDVELVRSWRNHPDVRSAMTTQHVIGMDEHRSWYKNSIQTGCRRLLVYEAAGQPLGFANLERSTAPGNLLTWGFYAAPGAPRGTGRRLCTAVLAYAFGQLAAHKVYAQVLDYNEKSVRLHHALGFAQEGTLREHCLVGSAYYDVLCFGLLRAEWEARN